MNPEPLPGQVYAFQFGDEICPLVVTHVDAEHVYYKFTDIGPMEYARSYPMCISTWQANCYYRGLLGTTTDPDALRFTL